MTLLHVTDLHFRRPWFDWLRHQAPAHSALIISGDLLDQRLPDINRQMAWVASWLRDSPVPVVVASGNHDLEWNASTYRWQPAYWLRELAPPVHPDGKVLEHDGLRIAAIACTQRPRSAPAEGWVVHAPPAKTRVSRSEHGYDRGDHLLADAVRKHAPAYVFSGHVHDPTRWHEFMGDSVVFNPGANPHGRFPNHLLLDLETGEACRYTDRLHGAFSERVQVPGRLVLR